MWIDIIGFEEFYRINEFGEIYSKRLNKILSPYITNKGYKAIDLIKEENRYKFLIHRLVALHFVPNPNNDPIVLHKDNNKLNTHCSNLKWGTYSENNSQAISDGLNKVPRPDNRKHYELYNDHDSVICFGGQEVLSLIGFGNESYLRNTIFRKQEIKFGNYSGYKIRRKIPKNPISFIES